MKFPSIERLAKELRLWNLNAEGPFWVYLAVWGDGEWGEWSVRDVESDAKSYSGSVIGSAFLPGHRTPVMNYKAVARNLIQQCRGAHAASVWR